MCGLVLCAALSCGKNGNTSKEQDTNAWQEKVAFDLSQIRPDGLTGPPDGLVSVSYEFCIPKSAEFLNVVLSIDSTIKTQPESPGRIGCGKTQYLCMGDTHNPRWKEILRQIASLEYVDRIERVYFE